MSNISLVSVVICSYNHAYYLPHSINSILLQSYPSVEIVVVDDGSTDNTKEVVAAFSNVKYIYKKNAGLAAARNTGIENATGDFLVFLDADDALLPNAIDVNMYYMQQNPNAAFVSGGHVSMDAEGNFTSIHTNSVSEKHYNALLQFNYIGMHATVMYQRWALDYYKFDPVLVRGCDDYDSYLNIAAKFPVFHHTQLLAAYRKHGNNISGNNKEMLYTLRAILKKHCAIITDKNFLEIAQIGFENWKNYYSNIEWKKFQKIPVFQVSAKIRSAFFLAQEKPYFLKSYFIGNYRKKILKNQLRKFFPQIFSTAKIDNIHKPKNQVFVLMYHRITNCINDTWGLTVTPDNFEKHLHFFKQHNLVISKEDFIDIINGKAIEGNKVFLTFDDGYIDNFITAKPLLEKYKMPATFFLTTNKINNEEYVYYWDVLEQLFLTATNLPAAISLNLNKGKINIKIAQEEQLAPCMQTQNWKAFQNKPFNARTKGLYNSWLYFQNLPQATINDLLHQLLHQCGVTIQQLQLPNIATKKDIFTLQKHPYINVGVHTVTHPILPSFSYKQQNNEILESKQTLEDLLDCTINSIAYPDGKYNATTLQVVADNNIQIGFTTKAGTVNKHHSTLELNRFQVYNMNAEHLNQKLQII